jgi:hypothetical protein
MDLSYVKYGLLIGPTILTIGGIDYLYLVINDYI